MEGISDIIELMMTKFVSQHDQITQSGFNTYPSSLPKRVHRVRLRNVINFFPVPSILASIPKEVAEEITAMEEYLFTRIKPAELLNQAWTKNAEKNAPNVLRATRWFDCLSLWTSNEVLLARTKQERARVITKLIEILQV